MVDGAARGGDHGDAAEAFGVAQCFEGAAGAEVAGWQDLGSQGVQPVGLTDGRPGRQSGGGGRLRDLVEVDVAGDVLLAGVGVGAFAGDVAAEGHQRALMTAGVVQLVARVAVVEEQQEPVGEQVRELCDQRGAGGGDFGDLTGARVDPRERRGQRGVTERGRVVDEAGVGRPIDHELDPLVVVAKAVDGLGVEQFVGDHDLGAGGS